MNTKEMEIVLSYMIEKMDPQSQDDIKEILGGDLPDLGQDALTKSGFALDRCPNRLKRRAALTLKDRSALRRTASPRPPRSAASACSRTLTGCGCPDDQAPRPTCC